MTKIENTVNSDMRVLKVATCNTLSGKSTLTYHIGCNPESEIYIRVYANTGGGFFSPEWISLKDIQQAFEKAPQGMSITSFFLQPLFKGKSVNTPAFLLSALIQEKLLQPSKSKKRHHEVSDPEDFMAKVEKLMAATAEVKIKVDTGKTAGTTGKTPKKPVIKKQPSTSKPKKVLNAP